MRFLVDANLSPRVAASLSSAGFESIHVADVRLLTAADQAILDYAAANGLVIVSADTDFGELLALSRGAVRPSAVLLRSADRLTPDQQAALRRRRRRVARHDQGGLRGSAGPTVKSGERRSSVIRRTQFPALIARLYRFAWPPDFHAEGDHPQH